MWDANTAIKELEQKGAKKAVIINADNFIDMCEMILENSEKEDDKEWVEWIQSLKNWIETGDAVNGVLDFKDCIKLYGPKSINQV